MKKRALAFLLAVSMVLGNTQGVFAAQNDLDIVVADEVASDFSNDSINTDDIILEEIETEDETDEASYEDGKIDDGFGIEIIDESEDEATEESSDDAAVAGSSDEEASASASGSSNDDAAAKERTIEDGIIYYEDPRFKDVPANGYTELENEKTPENPDVSGLASFNSNYTASKYITPNLPSLRNQSPWGTCWAHSSMALAEISLIKKGIATSSIDLSELHMAYYMYNTVVDPLGGTAGDSNGMLGSMSGKYLDRGGNLIYSEKVLANWLGAADESTAPYETAGETLSTGLSDSIAYKDAAHLANYYHAKIYFPDKDSLDLAPVKKLIVDYGAVGISYNATTMFSMSGDNTVYDCYNSANNAFYNPVNLTTNHAVTVVGWDDNFSKKNFNITPPGNGAWLVRNSWTTGDEYSYNGYFWMSYYEQSLGITAFAFDFESGSNYENNYQYDGAVADTCTWGDAAANVFTVNGKNSSEKLKAVAFAVDEPNTDYTVEIYTDLTDDTDPTSGKLAYTTNGTSLYEGYISVPVTKDITLSKGTKFSVLIMLKSDSYSWFVKESTMNYSNWIECTASSKAGQSFVYSYGEWSDIGANNGGNLRIKAFTDPANSVNPTGIKFNNVPSGGYSLTTDEQFTPSVTVSPSTATNKEYTLYSSDRSVVDIKDGKTIVGVSDGTATVTAITNKGDKKATVKVTVKTTYTFKIEGEYTIKKNSTFTFKVVTNPTGAKIQGNVEFYSSDPSVISIDKTTGKAKGLKAGYSCITAKIGSRKSDMYVTVIPSAPYDATYEVDGNKNVTLQWKTDKDIEYCDISAYDFIAKQFVTIASNLKPDENGSYTYTDTRYSKQNVATGTTVYYYIYAYEDYSSSYKEVPVLLKKTEKYDIVYVVSKGTNNSENPTSYRTGNTFTFKDPKADKGYTFAGWYKDSSFKTKKTGITSTDKGKITVYAKFDPVQYTIAFNANGGTGKMDSTKAKYGSKVTLPSNKFTYASHTFVKWNTKADGTGTDYANKASVTNLASTASTVTLYAVWTSPNEPASLNIYKSESKVNGKTTKVAVGKKVTLSAKVYDKSGKSADSQKVTYSSNNKAVATVTSAGVVTAVGNGEAVITVKSATKGTVKATTKIRVYTAAKSISLNKTSADIGLSGSEYSVYDVLTPSLLPASVYEDSNLADKSKITWKANKPSMIKWAKVADSKIKGKSGDELQSVLAGLTYKQATSSGIVTEKGYSLAIMSVKPGEVKVTATEPGKKSATCKFGIHTYVSSISLKTSSTLVKTDSGKYSATIKKGKTLKITPQVSLKGAAYSVSTSTAEKKKKTDAYNIAKKYSNGTDVTYTSSNTKVATVSSKGVITAKAKGTATITVTTNDRGKKNTIKVTVK